MSADDGSSAVDKGGLFVSNSLGDPTGSSIANSPCKVQPMGRLNEGEEIHPDAINTVETVKKVNSSSLSAYMSDGKSLIETGMDDKLSTCPDSAVTFCFWQYTDSYPISEGDAQAIVQLSEQYSDVITPPLQHELLRAYLYDDVKVEIDREDEEVVNPRRPNLLRLYRIGFERIAEASEDSDMEILAPVPVLSRNGARQRVRDMEFMTDLLQDYQDYIVDINMLCFNMLRQKPTAPSNLDVLRYLVGHMRRTGFFDVTLKYAVNVQHSWKEDGTLRTAEDLALAGMGFDFIGENHWRPQSDHSGDWEVNFRLFDTDDLVYREIPDVERDLRAQWPTRTQVDANDVMNADLDRELWRVQRIFNAEQVELALSDLRDAIGDGDTREFIQSHKGTKLLEDSFNVIAQEYDDPSTQASFNDYT